MDDNLQQNQLIHRKFKTSSLDVEIGKLLIAFFEKVEFAVIITPTVLVNICLPYLFRRGSFYKPPPNLFSADLCVID